jgi:IclR family acetate operon transcriptional repressor
VPPDSPAAPADSAPPPAGPFLPEQRREEVLGTALTALTDSTPTDATALRAELTAIRELGYSSSHGERQSDAGSIASTLFGFDGDVCGAVSVCGPRSRFTPAFKGPGSP